MGASGGHSSAGMAEHGPGEDPGGFLGSGILGFPFSYGVSRNKLSMWGTAQPVCRRCGWHGGKCCRSPTGLLSSRNLRIRCLSVLWWTPRNHVKVWRDTPNSDGSFDRARQRRDLAPLGRHEASKGACGNTNSGSLGKIHGQRAMILCGVKIALSRRNDAFRSRCSS